MRRIKKTELSGARPRSKRGGLAFRAIMVVAVLVLLSDVVWAVIPPSGSVITSQSLAEYVAGQSLQFVYSNPVQNLVLPVYAIQLNPYGSVAAPAFTLQGAGGDTLYCQFDLTNQGNARDSVAVSYRLVPPTNTTIAGMSFFDDSNNNGTLDPGEDDPSFLVMNQDETVRMGAAVFLPGGAYGGDAYIEVSTVSSLDTMPAAQTSVIRVINTNAPQMALYIGPRGNPRALPGGEGSDDDLTVGALDYSDNSFRFENDVLNQGATSDLFELSLGDSVVLPPGVTISFADSAGQLMQRSPTNPSTFLLGMLQPGETRPIQVQVASSRDPLHSLLNGPLVLNIMARSMTDTLQQNQTVDRLVPPQRFNPSASLSLKQTFHEPRASVGDVITFIVTAQNITDSVYIDEITIHEWAQPQLEFLSSREFEWDGNRLFWAVGELAGGESRTGIIKFLANGRVSTGKAKVVGDIAGTAETGDRVSAGPVISSIAIDNDIFGSEGIVFGEVFLDGNHNGVRDAGEGGVAGVAIYLDSGEYAVTDSLGRYSLTRVFTGYRTVRLDEAGLPEGLTFFEPLENGDGAGRESERLVHLLPGGHARVSFPVGKKTPRPAEVTHAITCQEKVSITKQTRLYKTLTLPSSRFALGKAKLMTGSAGQLGPIVDFLRLHPDWSVYLEGHTDSIPISTERFPSNKELSVARAQTVKNYLSDEGIEEKRIFLHGHGESRPLTSNETIGGRRLNRRVEVSFIPPGVRISQAGEVRPVNAAVKDLSALPDTFRVKILWELAVSSPEPGDATLSIRIPQRFLKPEVTVRLDDARLEQNNGIYDLSGFGRSKDVRCEISFIAGVEDTAFIENVEADLEIAGPPALAVTESKTAGGDLGKSGHTVEFRPFQGGRSTNATRIFDLDTWRQLVPAAENAPSLVSGQAASNGAHPASGSRDIGTENKRVFGLLKPGEKEVFSHKDQITVTAVLPLGAKTVLSVGDNAVPGRQVGERRVDVVRGVEEITWYGVRIQSGWNTILLRSTLLDGTQKTDSVKVALASRPAAIEPLRNRILLPADGRSTEVIRFSLADKLGLPVPDGTIATVVEGDSLVVCEDARPSRPGLQAASARGFIVLTTRPGTRPCRRNIAVECDGLRAECQVVFTPADRPLFATGLVDLKLGVFDKSGSGDPLGLDDFYDGVALKGGSRLFLQGPVAHGINLTARLDTKKRYEDPLLKETNPDRQYPIYGDASNTFYAAPSRGGNYVSLDRGESYVRYGDFRTPLVDGEFLSYHRAASGVSSAIVHGNNSLKSFVTRTDFFTCKDEIRADGTSGFYYLTRVPVVENSEKIVLETRDRYQTEIVLEVKLLVRNRDYTINFYDGSVLFKQAVSAVDRDFNPVFIVAVYEVDTGENSSYLYGARGDLAENKKYRVGAAAVARSGDGERYALYGLDGEVKLAGAALAAEFARSEEGAGGAGNAFKLEAAYKSSRGDHSVYLRRIDGDYSNPSFRGSSHELASVKSGFKSRLRISSAVAAEADGYLHRLDRTEEEKANARAGMRFQHKFFNFFCGGRVARHEEQQQEHSGVLSVVGLSGGSSKIAEFASRWEKNLGGESVEDYPDRLKSSLAVPFWGQHRFVASHEYLTARGRGGSNQAAAGVESRLTRSTTAYTRYSMNRTASDQRMGALTGLKQSLQLHKGLSGTFAVENFHSLSEREDDEYVSVKSGLSCRESGSYLAEAQYEYRWQERRTKHLVRVGASRQIPLGLAVLLKDVFAYSPDDDRNNALSYHGRLGIAYRPLTSPLKTLLMVRNSYERYTPVNPEAITWKLVFSGDLNVLPAPQHEVRLKYAFKRVEDYSYGISLTTNADLFLSQYVYHFARVWDVDLWGRMLRLRGGGTTELGTGVEIGRLFLRWVRVGAGYSVGGFDDPDITGTDAWSKGFGLRVQLILSDWVLREFGGM